MQIKQAVIWCGGVGERLKPITENIPKPMVDINGKPFLEYLINQLREQGISEIVLCTGYKKEIIEDYFRDGAAFGIKIKYSHGLTEWEQARRLWEAKDLIDDYFLLLYADNYVPSFNLKKNIEFYNEKNKILSFTVFKKTEKNNLKIDENNIVLIYDKTRNTEGLKYVELGYMIANKKRLFEFIDSSNISFQETIKRLVEIREIAALETKYKYQSISDIDRLTKTREYFSPKKIILVDRDGVINEKAPKGEYILKKEELRLIRSSIDSMKILSSKGFKFIILTNQPAISKGLISDEELRRLHNYLAGILKEEEIDILDIFYCPHDTEDNCECRKPNPGMIINACNKYLIDPKKTIFIGDDERDCLSAVRAGCKSILIGNEYDLSLNVKYHNIYVEPDYSSEEFSNAINFIISHYEEDNNRVKDLFNKEQKFKIFPAENPEIYSYSKIVSPEEAAIFTAKLKDFGKKVGLCLGCFDLLHAGHIKHLESAKKLCDFLIVAINTDRFIRIRKGIERPIYNEKIRAYMLAALEVVDCVVIFDYERGTEIIELIKPSYYIKGPDIINLDSPTINEEREMIKKVGGEMRYTNDPKWATTEILDFLKKLSE